MLFARNTQNNTGVAFFGDYIDFERLYSSLQDLVQAEEDSPYYSSSLKVLQFCYEVRNALNGNHEFTFIENGVNEEVKRSLSVLANNQNFYFKLNLMWTEALFLVVVLNDLLKIYIDEAIAEKKITEETVNWDPTVNIVRSFQSTINVALKKILTPNAHKKVMAQLNNEDFTTSDYLIQYIDHLNERYYSIESRSRVKNLPIAAKRIVNKDIEYRNIEEQFHKEAERLDCNINDLKITNELPEDIIW